MAGSNNPWVTTATPAPTERDPSAGPLVPAVTGAAAPQPAVPAPADGDLLPLRPTTDSALVWWVGAHGGAGESTLAGLLPGSRAAAHAWPVTANHLSGGVGGELDALETDLSATSVVLVGRTSMHGLRRVQRAAVQWASAGVPGVHLIGVALIADAPGRLPRPLRDFAAVVGGGVPRVWRLPWVEPWRLLEASGDAVVDDAPRDVQRFLDEVQALVPAARPSQPHQPFVTDDDR